MMRAGDVMRVTLAVTGASGAPYALRLIEQLLVHGCELHLMVSAPARQVIEQEVGLCLPARPAEMAAQLVQHCGVQSGTLHVYGKEEWSAPVASGSAAPRTMIVCPCSTGSLSAIAHGSSDNLIERAADVVLKERGRLIVVVRETPLSEIHLENMLRLSRMGAVILPAMPGFYQPPQAISDLVDFIVARILDHAGIEHTLLPRWGYGGEG